MVRWLLAIIGVAAVAGVAIFSGRQTGLPVDVATAETASIREYVEEQAKTRLPEIYEITMPLEGRVLPISLREGDPVKEGDIVARLDDRDLETEWIEQDNTIKRYAANLDQIDLTIQQAEHTVEASQAKYDFAEGIFSRTKSLVDANSASLVKLEQDELQMTGSALDLRKEKLNKSIYVLLKGVVELMRETDLAKRTKIERDRQRTIVRSPVSGVVLTKHVSNETVMAAGSLLLEIGDPDQLQVESELLTQDVAKVQIGDPVDIEGPAIGAAPVTGHVARIYPQGFTKVSSLGVEQQRVIVVIDFDDGVLGQLAEQGRQLGVDYRVHVKIYTDQAENAVTIPRAAIFRGPEGQWQVFRVRDDRIAELTNVAVGLRNDFRVQIVGGIRAGERVIVAPDSTLKTGTPVRFESEPAAQPAPASVNLP